VISSLLTITDHLEQDNFAKLTNKLLQAFKLAASFGCPKADDHLLENSWFSATKSGNRRFTL